jgi:putative SbcD/Mre11-related phosphoesterase
VTDPPADVEFTRRAAYLCAADALVVADIHLGRDQQSDVQLPLGEREDVLERFGAALDRFGPDEVVVAGDLLHSFRYLPDEVAEALDAIAALVADAGADLVVTPGNHDTVLGGAFDGRTAPEHRLDDGTVVCHGHEFPDVDADRYVLGHDHPAITIEGRKHPCFLYGPGVLDDAAVLVLPAFNRLARGAVVDGMHGDDFMSPVLAEGAGDYRPIVFDEDADEALAFPSLSRLREHL